MSSSDRDRPKPPGKIANGKFEIEKKLGAGCFGEVYRGYSTHTGQHFAVKFEYHQGHALQLEHEAKVLKQLTQGTSTPQGFAQCMYFGHEGQYDCMVIELLGRSLEDRLQGCSGRFNQASAVLIADQLLQRIEYLHSKGILHRDIKPENFMFGLKSKIHHIYLIDFGLSKRYFDWKHCRPRSKLRLTGTARYASINAHRGMEQSRRDDLEAIGHMLIYFLRGSLPWSGLEAKTQEEKYRKIREKKESVLLDDLCQGHPDAFKIYLKTARGLDFKQRPDYNAMRKLFRDVRDSQGGLTDHGFQWLDGKDLGALVPLVPLEGVRQPDDQPATSLRGLCALCGSTPQVRD